jgi:hypothetical protein
MLRGHHSLQGILGDLLEALDVEFEVGGDGGPVLSLDLVLL